MSAGIYETNQWITQPMEMPQGVLVPIARQIRAHVDGPLSVSGRITDASVAKHILASGVTDFVTLGRALHADPEFPNKAREGRLDEICTCIGCNQGCSDRHSAGKPILCLVNSTTGRERELAIRATTARKRIVVVGAGPAGPECARVAALRGHQGMILEFRPDVLVLASGAHVGIPQIPGVLDSPVVDAYDVLRRPIGGGRALTIGGGIRGVGLARVLAAKGMDIILAEAGHELLPDIGARSRPIQTAALAALPNVQVHLGTTVEALGVNEACLWDTHQRWQVEIDRVIPVRPLLPVLDLAALADLPEGLDLHLIDDCLQPRDAMVAMHEAAALGHRL